MSFHDKSCLLDAFAKILMEPIDQVVRGVGHHGEYGYHTQELIEYCLIKGYTVTAIERDPIAANTDGHMWEVIFAEGNGKRFGRHLQGKVGVLLGQNRKGIPHAVAWRDDLAYDPSLSAWYHILKDGEPDDEYFKPKIFLRIDRWKA